MQATDQLREGIAAIPGLEVVGEPKMSVVAFKSVRGSFDVYKLNDALSARGWHFSALQLPPALHMCLTAAHAQSVPAMLQVRRCACPQSRPPVGQSLQLQQRAVLLMLNTHVRAAWHAWALT